MNKYLLVYFLFLVFTNVALNAETVCILPDIKKPRNLVVENGKAIITDDCSMIVVELQNCRKSNQVGRRGQGPGEYYSTPFLAVTDQKYYLAIGEKIGVYNKKLEKILEYNSLGSPMAGCALDDRTVRCNSENDEQNSKISYFIVLNDGKTKIHLADVVMPIADREKLIFEYPRIKCAKDKIFLYRPSSDFRMEIYNREGKLERVISKKMAAVHPGEVHRRRFMEVLIEISGIQKLRRYNRLSWLAKKKLPKVLPPLANFFVKDDVIYVRTHDVTDEKDRYFSMNLQGDILKSFWLPKVPLDACCFYRNRFYYIVDSEDGYCLMSEEIK